MDKYENDYNDYLEEDEPDIGLVEGTRILYTSGELSRELGVSRDMVRYYTNEFIEFLNVTKTKEGKGGHNRYSPDDLNTLKMIVGLHHNQHKSIPEIKALLKVPGVNIVLGSSSESEQVFAAILAKNNQFILEQISKMLEANRSQLIVNKEQELSSQIKEKEELMVEIKELRDICTSQKELLEELMLREKVKKGIFGFFKKNN